MEKIIQKKIITRIKQDNDLTATDYKGYCTYRLK